MNLESLNTANTAQGHAESLSNHRVLRSTYALLAMTLLFSAVTAGVSMSLNLPHPGLLLTLIGYIGLLFAVTWFRNSAVGLAFVFALTGFMGYTLGPMLNQYLALQNGGQSVMTVMGATGAVLLGLSAYSHARWKPILQPACMPRLGPVFVGSCQAEAGHFQD